MAEKQTKHFKVNFSYPDANGVLRSQSLVVLAADIEDAQKQATVKLTERHNVFKLAGVAEYI